MTTVKTVNQVIKVCNFSKLIEYMKSDKMPDIPGYEKCSVLEIIENDNQITKILRKKLPVSKAASLILGGRYANFRYDIVYDEKTIVCVASNPHVVDKYFRYNESITIKNIGDGKIEIIREAETINFTEGMMITSLLTGTVEENYHTQCITYLDAIIDECKD